MPNSPIPILYLLKTIFKFSPVWIGGALLFGGLGFGYSKTKKDSFAARQSMVIREEANTAVYRLGRFDSQTELKAAQETILQVARNPEVVAAALREIGPPKDWGKSEAAKTGARTDANEEPLEWPSKTVVDDITESHVNVLAPQGSDFGNTEVIFLSVEAESKQRAMAFCSAMFKSLTEHLRSIRMIKADSMIEELALARKVASDAVDETAAKMRLIEIEFGSDLSELRSLSESLNGSSSNRQELDLTNCELQAAELQSSKLQAVYNLLTLGAEDPQRLLIAGNDLLTSQPSLQRLKEGLIDAQIQTSRLSGIYTETNPKVLAARATENEIRTRLQTESKAALIAMKPQLELQAQRVAKLKTKKDKLSDRLVKLAEARTSYAKIAAEVKYRTEQLAAADRVLSEARATRSSAMSTDLLAKLGPPQVDDKPSGTSKKVLIGGAVMAGLFFGFGIVFLVAPAPTESISGRRWSNHLADSPPQPVVNENLVSHAITRPKH